MAEQPSQSSTPSSLDATRDLPPAPAPKESPVATQVVGLRGGTDFGADESKPNREDLVGTKETNGGGSNDPSTPALAEDASAHSLSTLKDFRLIKKLGEGGMGAVYKAHQISLDRVVAVKVPFKHLAKDKSFVARFYREARVMAKLDYPNILRCFSVGEENGWHYLAMEYIDGASMQSWLNKLGKLSVGDALHVILACAYALRHAHEQDLIHRDIKPDNILITSKGVVKVADLGLAKVMTDDLGLSQTGAGMGTPHYMAPEQARDAKHVDGRSDIYALGSMLYCFLTGKPPFAGETYIELLLNKEKGKFTPARRVNPDVPEKLDLMIDKSMAVKPEHRYKTCAEFIKDLESLGLASEALSFIPGAVAPVQVKTFAPGTQPAPAVPTMKAPSKGAITKPTLPPPGSSGPSAAGFWYVMMEAEGGKMVKRKLTTAQITDKIKKKELDLESQTSRGLKGPYRNLNHYKEFEHALAGRLAQAKADKKTAKYHGMYEKIMAEEKTYKRKRWLQNMFRSTTSMVSFLVFLAVIAVVAYFVVTYGLRWWNGPA